MSELAQKLTGGISPGGESEQALDALFKYVPGLRKDVEKQNQTFDRIRRSFNVEKGK